MADAIPRGRLSAQSNVAALSKVVALTPRAEAVNASLESVIASAAFQNSRRAQDFLRYVVEHALKGGLGDLKERSIGAALFGRALDYDTGADAVVRVTANDLRKRLMRYYQEGGQDDPVRFDLPPGAYVPEIRLIDPRPAAAEPGSSTLPARRSIAPQSGWIFALALAIVWMGSALASRWSGPASAARKFPWAAIFDSPRAPQLVMADGSM